MNLPSTTLYFDYPFLLKCLIFIIAGMSQSPFVGPIAPENNPTIEPQWFAPSAFPITAIALGPTTTVTVSDAFGVACNYVVGQQVRFVIPPFYGTYQLDGKEGFVTSVPGTNQVVVSINTAQNYNAFVASPPYSTTVAQLLAIGDVNTGPINTSRTGNQTYVQGSFINISPSIGGTN